MYRSRHLLGKQTQTILRYRSRFGTAQTRGLLERSSIIKNKGSNGKLMSTASKGNLKNLGFYTFAVGYNISLVLLLAKYEEGFRQKIEVVPGMKYVFGAIIPRTAGVTSDGFVPATEEEKEYEEVQETEVQLQEANTLDVTVKEEEEEFEIIPSEDESVTQTEVEEEKINELLEKQTHILTTSYENLRILLDDTITIKTSAAIMLDGYITQFTQALLIAKEDSAYESIWGAISVLDRSIEESIELVKVKETEVNTHTNDINRLIDDIREHGDSDTADKAEALIVSSNERLLQSQSDIELSRYKVNHLFVLRKRLDGSPEKLQNYLHAFIPDFMKLLHSKQVDVEDLSIEDAILMLSLKRVDLIYAEGREKETEQELRFEANLQQQKENILKETDAYLNNVVEKLEVDKDNELNQKVEDLNQLHENHLQEELKIQHEAHQQEIDDSRTEQRSELAAQYEAELELTLNEKEVEHLKEINSNLSYLRGIESKITDVLDSDKKALKNQNLWVAVHALNTALNDISENGRTKKLIPEISSILQCNHNDDIIPTIIATVPEHAVNLGVLPENALIHRFHNIKRVCKRVAMVGEGGSAFAYIFSYFKSMFVISQFYQRNVTDEIDLETLGPYEILEKADYCIQKGDLEQAAKFMSHLKGVARKLSIDWLREVQLLLETKQSANLLLAYVGSLNIGFE